VLSYRSQVEARQLPRSSVTLDEGCTILVEGWKRRRYWTWSVLDAEGGLMLRFSSTSESEGKGWVEALQRACGAPPFPQGTRGAPAHPHARAAGLSATAAADGFFGPEPPPPPLQAAARVPLRKSPSSRAAAAEAAAAARAARAGAGPRPGGALFGSTPVHVEPRDSPLSGERLLYTSQAGLFNLLFVILVVNHARLIVENLLRYGVRVQSGFWLAALGLGRGRGRGAPLAAAFCALPLFALAAAAVERAALRGALRARWERSVAAAHSANLAALLAMPWLVIARTQAPPLPSFILLSSALVLWMKLVSYAHANADLRSQYSAAAAAKKGGASPLPGGARQLLTVCAQRRPTRRTARPRRGRLRPRSRKRALPRPPLPTADARTAQLRRRLPC